MVADTLVTMKERYIAPKVGKTKNQLTTQTDAQFQNVTHPASHMAFVQAQTSVLVKLAGMAHSVTSAFLCLDVSMGLVDKKMSTE
jgi:hypothetical protein